MTGWVFFKPIFFTALTTSIGFSALAVTELVPLKQYALLAAAGSLIIFFVAMSFFVCFLSVIQISPHNYKPIKSNVYIEGMLKNLTKFIFVNKNIILSFAFISIIFTIVTVPKITVDSNIFNYFKSNSWINQDMQHFDKLYKFGGLEIVIDSGRTDGIKNPEFLRTVALVEKDLNDLQKTGKVNSLIEFLKQLRKALNGDDINYFILPDSSEMTAQLLLMYENSGPNEDLSDLVDFDNRYLRLSVPIENLSAKDFSRFYNFHICYKPL